MIHTILDTNILRANPGRNNAHFQALKKLAQAERVKIHIPYVVEREFQTQQLDLYTKDIDKAIAGLTGLERKELSPGVAGQIATVRDTVQRIRDAVMTDSQQQFTEWLQEVRGAQVPLTLEQSQGAMDAYFLGVRPLKSVKVREDIPDSFVVQSVEHVIRQCDSVHLVAGDKKILDAFEGHAGATVYPSLADFIDSGLIQNELMDVDVLQNLEQLTDAIVAFEDDFGELAAAVSRSIGRFIDGEKIRSHSIPDDNHEATITGYNDPDSIEFNFPGISYLGNGKFGIPFVVSIEVAAYFYIYKADYYSLYDDRGPSISDHNDYYFEAEDEFQIEVDGIATLVINRENIDFDDFSSCVDFDSFEIDSIKTISLSE